ncbi:glucuronyl hydrolase, partial [Bacillus thuringiensis]|nr:glucuronyl hydrolase [Bacillus thuringiensis]
MNVQQKKEMLIELGTFVDKNWLDEQFEWCMMRIKKNMVRFG